MPAFDESLHFPVPGAHGVDDAAAIRAWHQRLAGFMRAGGQLPGLSARARAAFYRRTLPEGGVDDLLLWRASFVDWLADVWDVIGEPELEIGECQALERLLTPRAPDLCPFCLTPLLPEHDPCPMLQRARGHWPTSPWDAPPRRWWQFWRR